MRNAFRYLRLAAILALILNFAIFFNRLEISGSSWANMRIGIFVYHKFQEEIQARLWIDVPNAFPWRECLHVWDGHVITQGCAKEEEVRQTFLVQPGEGSGFHLVSRVDNEDHCVLPSKTTLEVQVRKQCPDGAGFWRWRDDTGQLLFGTKCLASTGSRGRLRMEECDDTREQQLVEVGQWGRWVPDKVGPLDQEAFHRRAARSRERELALAETEVFKVLDQIKAEESSGSLFLQSGSRRAVVFYLDKGTGFLSYLTWWLLAWKEIGLDSEDEEFDLILMTHPTSIKLLPPECKPVPDNFDPSTHRGPGMCLYKELLSIHERDPHYDPYLNSQECLFNAAAAFLSGYSSLLRADLDTFPTPGMLGLRPNTVICYRGEAYTHHRPEIERAIVESANAVGIKHQHWHNAASSWMGPTRRILALARLTTVVARFLRVHMFGPGTKCRCASCSQLPDDCTWGGGIYAGTLLLYAQEIAINRLWSEAEYKAGGKVVLDGSTTDPGTDICKRALLHARHNAETFSKFAFLMGKYKEWDLASLDITKLSDFCMYIAITSAGQGVNREGALERFHKKSGGRSLNSYCTKPGR